MVLVRDFQGSSEHARGLLCVERAHFEEAWLPGVGRVDHQSGIGGGRQGVMVQVMGTEHSNGAPFQGVAIRLFFRKLYMGRRRLLIHLQCS